MSENARPTNGSMIVGMLIGLGVGLMITAVVGYVLSRQANLQAGAGATVTAVVAATDLPAGTPLAFEKLASRNVPEVLATPSVVRNEEMSQVLGRRTRIDLRAGDLIYNGALEGGGAAPAFPPDEDPVQPPPDAR